MFRLLSGIALAHLLLFVSFYWQPFEFWLLFPFSLFVMVLYSLSFETMNWTRPTITSLLLSAFTGVALYLLIVFGKYLVILLSLPFLTALDQLATIIKPREWWHYLVLFLFIIPGEEIFWRGFVQKRLQQSYSPFVAVIGATLLYASAHLYAGSVLLIAAAIVGGLVWGYIYIRTNNLLLAIASHVIFDLFLLVIFPIL
ncbi:type II CAAX endopeptidase family protein [Alkalihalobacillus sp. LMS39]|uniref:CPBP family intramembrane glutamic endopeptidase n=1 Tax=Alkalihalobacillus sp. LMS39 TaxID=2924032 RepID=UPI001FB3DE8D|nr:type II CAAX endopeptidase family protein [Alkalihalobacillus sp. LMS39]UOE95973.1 CPBP family intramembrane metalloprotease [Alkalihalobacillus sp. LMS39]